jgi:hypothetical protein
VEVFMPPDRADIGVPRAFAAARLGVTPHTVSMWVLRGYQTTVVDAVTGETRTEHRRVRAVGWWRGARLYRWGDLVDAECATRNHRNSTRNPGRRRSPIGASV